MGLCSTKLQNVVIFERVGGDSKCSTTCGEQTTSPVGEREALEDRRYQFAAFVGYLDRRRSEEIDCLFTRGIRKLINSESRPSVS